jgi:hypothetical protein
MASYARGGETNPKARAENEFFGKSQQTVNDE